MNEWIESHTSLPRHRKLRCLTRLLGVSVPETLGYLHLLWYYVLEFAPHGLLDGHSPQDIAEACMWRGDPETFVQALVEAGWLDQTNSGLVVHDWNEYNRLHRERQKAAERQARRRARLAEQMSLGDEQGTSQSDVTVMSPLCHRDVTRRQDKIRISTTKVVDCGTTHVVPTENDDRKPPLSVDEAVEMYHKLCPSLPRVKVVNEARRRRLRAVIRELGREGLENLFRRAEASDFLSGRSGKWRANLDFLIRPSAMPRVLEGVYDDVKGTARGYGRFIEIPEELCG